MTTDSRLDESGQTEEAGELSDDFLFHFYQGGELMSQGRLEEARQELERADQITPNNPRCLNLLGLINFKLGDLDRSIEIYRELVASCADEATLRVNLATVYLKAGRLEEASDELQLAIQQDPGHQKAHRTLAVVLARMGEPEGARVHLDKAGVEDAGRFLSSLPPDPDSPPAQTQPVDTDDEEANLGEPERFLEEADAVLDQGPVQKKPLPAQQASLRIEGPFLDIRSTGRLFTRLEGLVWMQGDLSFSTVKKRFGGQATRYTFDQGARAMLQVEGEGGLRLQANNARFHLLTRGTQAAYFLEEYVFAFTEVDTWENGRLPFQQEEALAVFHLRGPAQVVIRCPGDIRRQRVGDQESLLLDVRWLVGWTGDLHPRLIKLERPMPEVLCMELRGSGEVLYLLDQQG